MKPSLDNPYARVRRAKQHLPRLKRAINAFFRANAGQFSRKYTGTGIFVEELSQPPPAISILVGECVYNLRAALDYLAYELAILDSGNVQDGTQFPIEDTKTGWDRNCGRYLKSLSPTHRSAIETLQPYNGCIWTRTLRSLSNPDKHRTLSIVRLKVLMDVPSINASTFIVGPHTGVTMSPAGLKTVNVNMNISFDVAFDDGTPVMETLEMLQSEVAALLGQFNPEF